MRKGLAAKRKPLPRSLRGNRGFSLGANSLPGVDAGDMGEGGCRRPGTKAETI